MDLKIQSIFRPFLDWNSQAAATPVEDHLPGSVLATTSGNFGQLSVQECSTQNYCIRYIIVRTVERLVLRFYTEDKGIIVRLILSGNIREYTNGKWQQLAKNNFTIHSSPYDGLVSFDEGAVFRIFEVSASQPLLDEIITDYAPLSKTLNAMSEQTEVTPEPHWAHLDSLDLIKRIFKCNYEGDLLRVYLENRLRDLLIQYLLPSFELKTNLETIPERERAAVYKAEQIITKDVSNHFHVPQIAKMVGLNEFRLKAVFKQIYGVGPYEYLVRQRMVYAKDLLEAGLAVKEAAAKTGYARSNFSGIFKDYYGYTPGRIKRK